MARGNAYANEKEKQKLVFFLRDCGGWCRCNGEWTVRFALASIWSPLSYSPWNLSMQLLASAAPNRRTDTLRVHEYNNYNSLRTLYRNLPLCSSSTLRLMTFMIDSDKSGRLAACIYIC